MAQALGIEFTRAQFTPDLLPADLTGSFIYNQRIGDFEFREGPLFTGLLLADEINRTPPKTQAALLEAMQERQVTVEGRTFELTPPFHVLATANPVEYEGTYPLPEAQLDRFLLCVGFGYPTAEEEYDVLHSRIARRQELVVLDPVTDAAGLLEMQAAVEEVEVDRSVSEYCIALVTATRTHRDVLIGASPRGSLALMLCARALALISGRDFVLPEDVKTVAPAALAHRVTVKPELWMTDVSGASVVAGLLETVPTPAAQERAGRWTPP
jgi:MoxR-like ATPase